jgi:hypothetical protein
LPRRGKIKSLEDASATTAAHVQLLLGDVAAVCSSKAAGSADDVKAQAEKLQKVGAGRALLEQQIYAVSCAVPAAMNSRGVVCLSLERQVRGDRQQQRSVFCEFSVL